MKLVSVNIPKDSAEAAGYWVVRLESPNCGPADRTAFEAWRAADKRHAEAYARAQNMLGLVDLHLGSMELTELGEQVFVETRKSHKSSFYSAAVGLAMACTLIVSVVLIQQTRVIKSENILETAVGQRSTITLSDDSIVTLNTDSLVELRYTQDVRQLVLVRGQAHFEVKKEPRPFEVLAGDQRIVALGTAFDVRLDADQSVQVTLVEGRISIDEATLSAPVKPSIIPSTIDQLTLLTELEAGEQLIVEPDALPLVVKADIEQVVGWLDGRLVFRKDSLEEAVAEFNRYSSRKIVVANDARLDAIKVNGVFNAGSTNQFVAALETLHPIKAREFASDRIELRWWDAAGLIATETDTLH
ncbi:MAG: FecR domain-containing protein [Pseudomonadales bacterium]|nr:FecR domain-containing protein [Pseudomonadales bacterium]